MTREQIKRFSSNIFDGNILNKKDIITLVKNLVKTINLTEEVKKLSLLEEEQNKILESFGLIDKVRSRDNLKKLLGPALFDEVLESIKRIDLKTIFENKYVRKYSKNYRIYASKILEQKDTPTMVDLFSGSGGLSLGIMQSGFRVLLANDIEKSALQTYSFNHPEVNGRNITLGGIEILSENIKEYVSEKVDLIIGGPPCQGFSEANRQRIIDDPRNKLYKYYVEFVKTLKPKVFVMENVKGMLKVADQVIEDFNGATSHYDISFEILKAKEYGIPQNRERLIYIGIRKDIIEKLNISAEDIMENILNRRIGKEVPLYKALEGLRELKASTVKNNAEYEDDNVGYLIDNINSSSNDYLELINEGNSNKLIFNHKARYNNDRDIEIYSRMLPGDKSDSPRIADIMPYKSRNGIFKDKYFKLIPNVPCKTITAHMKFDCNMYVHPYQARGLTPREAARVQSYPDDYFFQGAFTKTYQQIGNSVPPVLARNIGEEIIKYCK